MAEIDLIKISELPATSTIGDADELAVVQGVATKKVPYSVLKAGAEVTPDTTLSEAGVPADASAVGAALALKANQAAVTQALAAKADKSEVTDISGDIAELASVVETKADQTALNQKADKTTTDALRQDLTTLNGIVNQKADKTELNAQIGNVTAELATKANTADVNNLLAAKANVASPVFTGRPQAPTAPKGTATLQLATTAFVQNAIDDKEDKLTFDSAPTQGSTNPVTSGGVYTAVESAKADAEEAATEAKNLALGAYATPTASGSLLTITDGADGIPAKKLTLNLVPHQSGSGDPSPDNMRPISGYDAVTVTRKGKNLIQNIKHQASTSAVYLGHSGTQFVLRLPKGTYTLSVTFLNGASGGAYYRFESDSANRNIWSSTSELITASFVIDKDEAFRMWLYNSSGISTDDVGEFMVEVGNTATAYEPYQGDTYTITIPTAAGTVYGGSLEINEDGSGTLTVDRGFVTFDGTEDWREATYNYTLNFTQFADRPKANESDTVLSDRFVSSATQGIRAGGVSIGVQKVAIPETVTSLAEWKTWLASNNTQCCYLLETPQTYALTAEEVTTLLGNNTLWMDADGTIDLAYRADTTLYISNLITGIRNNIAYIEDGTTASRAYSVGQFVLIGGQLYKVTASIASGATFTIGTNVTATTVGTELTALA